MSALVIGGDVSGTVTLQAPSAAGATVLMMPATSGTLVTTAGGNATSATNLADGVAGNVPYQSSPGVTAFVSNGTNGQILTSNGSSAPSWSSTLENPTLTGFTETVYALGTSGSLDLDPENGTVQTCALTGNPTFVDSLSSGQSIVLMLTNGASYTVTYPTMTWVTSGGNTAPTLTAADTLVFWKVSTTLYGAYVGSYA